MSSAMVPFVKAGGKHVATALAGAVVRGGTKRAASAIEKAISGERNTDQGGVGKKTKNEQQPVSQYHEQEVTYTNPGKGISKKKKKKNALRAKILDVLAAENALQSVIRFHKSQLTTANNVQIGQIFTLYGLYGTPGIYDDLSQISYDMSPVQLGITTTTLGVPLAPANYQNKLLFTHACMELTITNTSSSNLAMLNVYEIEWKKDMEYAAPYSALEVQAGKSAWLNQGSASQITIGTVGVTPFQFPDFTSRIKIVSKRAIQLPPNATTLLQYNDARHRTFTQELLKQAVASGSNTYCGLGGWTRGYLVTQSGTLDASSNYEPTAISYSAMKRYSVRVISTNSTTLQTM